MNVRIEDLAKAYAESDHEFCAMMFRAAAGFAQHGDGETAAEIRDAIDRAKARGAASSRMICKTCSWWDGSADSKSSRCVVEPPAVSVDGIVGVWPLTRPDDRCSKWKRKLK